MVILQDHKTDKILEIIQSEEPLETEGVLEYKGFLYDIKSVHHHREENLSIYKVKPQEKILVTSFEENNHKSYRYLEKIERRIRRILDDEKKKTHVHKMHRKGPSQIAKKFGEEAVELVIESGKDNEISFKDEAADTLYYYLILLHERGLGIEEVLQQLKKQKRKN